VLVVKADGTKELFDERKIIRTCLRSGANKETAIGIAKEIKRNVKEGTTTREIYKMIVSLLMKAEKVPAFLFRLREAMAELDPVSFEVYTKKLLESCGYKCRWNVLVKGKCVEHQVDVIAKRENLFLVECKHHTNQHRLCGLGSVLQVQARLEDVMDGYAKKKNGYDFTHAWIITNTKFSNHAKKYAKAKNILLTGWGTKPRIVEIAQANKLYPVTLLMANRSVIGKLLHAGIISLHDLLKHEKKASKITGKETKNIMKQATSLIL